LLYKLQNLKKIKLKDIKKT